MPKVKTLTPPEQPGNEYDSEQFFVQSDFVQNIQHQPTVSSLVWTNSSVDIAELEV